MNAIVCPRCGKRHEESISNCPDPQFDEFYNGIHLSINEIPLPNSSLPKPLTTPCKKEILSLLQCPINWNEIVPDEFSTLGIALEKYWRSIATLYLDEDLEGNDKEFVMDPDSMQLFEVKMDSETDEVISIIEATRDDIVIDKFSGYFNPMMLVIEKEDDLEIEMPLIRERIKNAKSEYEDVVYRFKKMRLATEDEYFKHLTGSNLSNEQIKTKTSKNKKVSLFYKDVSLKSLEEALWSLIEEYWISLLEVNQQRVFMESSIIGASKGKDANFICFDLDLCTPLAHAFPILENDLPSTDLLIRFS